MKGTFNKSRYTEDRSWKRNKKESACLARSLAREKESGIWVRRNDPVLLLEFDKIDSERSSDIPRLTMLTIDRSNKLGEISRAERNHESVGKSADRVEISTPA